MTEQKRKRGGFGFLILGVAALVGLQLVLSHFLAGSLLPTRKAQWIWLDEEPEEPGPVAFYAVREFELEETPTAATLFAAADEEAVIFINGVPVGGSRYTNGDSLRSCDVFDAVRVGTNRIVAEVRSVRGVGGLIARLVVTSKSGKSQIVTDSDWQIYREPQENLFESDLELPAGEIPRVWGPAPTGRWMLSSRPKRVPTIAELQTSAKAESAQRFRLPTGDRRWQPLGQTDRSSPALGHWVTFDFGREITAYLALRFPSEAREESKPVGLLYLGRKPRILNRSRADGYVVAMPGQRMWLNGRPRRFRYATYVGLLPVSGADAYPVDEQRADKLGVTEDERVGAFGLPVGELGPSLEDEVWGELHRLTSVADAE